MFAILKEVEESISRDYRSPQEFEEQVLAPHYSFLLASLFRASELKLNRFIYPISENAALEFISSEGPSPWTLHTTQ